MDSKDYWLNFHYGRARTKRTEEVTQCKEEGPTSIFGEGARVQLPSMDGTPIEAAKMRRSPGSRISGTTKKQDNLDSSDAIGRKKL